MESYRKSLPQLNREILRPTKWLSAYEDLVTKNVNTVNQIESALRSLTYIIPGKTKASNALQPQC